MIAQGVTNGITPIDNRPKVHRSSSTNQARQYEKPEKQHESADRVIRRGVDALAAVQHWVDQVQRYGVRENMSTARMMTRKWSHCQNAYKVAPNQQTSESAKFIQQYGKARDAIEKVLQRELDTENQAKAAARTARVAAFRSVLTEGEQLAKQLKAKLDHDTKQASQSPAHNRSDKPA